LGEDQGGYLAALQGGLMLGLKCRFILEKEKVGGICINVGCITDQIFSCTKRRFS